MMNRILHINNIKSLFIIVCLSLFYIVPVCAQQAKVKLAEKEMEAGNFENAKKLIDEASVNPETSRDADTWYYKAYIYKELFKKSTIPDVRVQYRNKAIEASKKSLGLNKESEQATETRKILKFLNQNLYNEAATHLNSKQYSIALSEYEAYVDALPYYEPTRVDTMVYTYLGYASHGCNKKDKAIMYLSKSLELKPNQADVYLMLADDYISKKEPEYAIHTLEKGFSVFPANLVLRNNLIAEYKNTNKTNLLEKFLLVQLEKAPNDKELLMPLAWAYERKIYSEPNQRNVYFEKALHTYDLVISLDSNNYLANYNSAILLYNSAVEKIDDMSYDVGLTELSLVQDETIAIFKRALPYMQKAYALDPKNKNTVIGLSGIYFSLNDNSKYLEFKSMSENMK